jgi:RNA polymerase sigma factor (sigma-70 family)
VEQPNEYTVLIQQQYQVLRMLAERMCRRQPPDLRLLPSELLHETWIQLQERSTVECADSDHIRAIAIRKMRQVAADFDKHWHAQKRGGSVKEPLSGHCRTSRKNLRITKSWTRVSLDSAHPTASERQTDRFDVRMALDELRTLNPRWAIIIERHFYSSKTHSEVAHELGVSSSTAEKEFRRAVQWLNHRLRPAHGTNS